MPRPSELVNVLSLEDNRPVAAHARLPRITRDFLMAGLSWVGISRRTCQLTENVRSFGHCSAPMQSQSPDLNSGRPESKTAPKPRGTREMDGTHPVPILPWFSRTLTGVPSRVWISPGGPGSHLPEDFVRNLRKPISASGHATDEGHLFSWGGRRLDGASDTRRRPHGCGAGASLSSSHAAVYIPTERLRCSAGLDLETPSHDKDVDH